MSKPTTGTRLGRVLKVGLAGEAETVAGLKQNYVRKQRTAIRAAVRDGHAPDGFRDPFDRLRGDALLRSERVERGWLTVEEVAALASARAARPYAPWASPRLRAGRRPLDRGPQPRR